MEKKVLKHFLIAGSIGVVALLASFFSWIRPKNLSTKNSEWMKSLANATSLAEVSLPGTHDSGATLSLFDSAGKCQDLTIAEQLNLGARFLDIRLKGINDDLFVYHGFINEELPFQRVLDTCYRFLEAHPSEGLVFSVKEEAKASGCQKGFDALLKEYVDAKGPDYWWTKNALPTIGEMRGKLVLLSRYENNTIGMSAGPQSAGGWQDTTTFDMNQGVAMHIQDTYKLKANLDKWSEVEKCLEYTNSASKGDRLVINFLSGYLDKKVAGVSFAVAAPTAQYINPLAKSHLPSYKKKGIVLFDFFTEELADAVLEVTA